MLQLVTDFFSGNKAQSEVSPFVPLNNAYRAGIKAYNDGILRSDCPYKHGSYMRFWQNGWEDASFGVKE